MPRRTQISALAGQPPGAAGVAVSPAALSQAVASEFVPWEGLGDLGESLGDVAINIKQVADEKKILEKEREFSEMAGEFENQLHTDSDPGKWLEKFDALDKPFRNDLDISDLSPIAQERLKTRLADFSHKQRLRIGSRAAIAVARESRLEFKNRINSLYNNEQFADVPQTARDIGPRLGMTDAEIDSVVIESQAKAKDFAEQQAAEAEDNARIATLEGILELQAHDPFAATDRIKNSDLDPADKARMMSRNRTAINQRQSEAKQSVVDGIVSGEMSPRGMERIMRGAQLGASDKKALVDYREKYAKEVAENSPIDYEAVTDVVARIEAYDYTTDPSGEVYVQLYQDSELAGLGEGDSGRHLAGALRQRLYQKNPLLQHEEPDTKMPPEISKALTAALDAHKKAGAFGSKASRERDALGNPKYVETTGSLLEWAKWNEYLTRTFKAEFDKDPEKFMGGIGAVNDWVFEQLKGKTRVQALQQDLPRAGFGFQDSNELPSFDDSGIDMLGALRLLGVHGEKYDGTFK